jgi:hypothetical protein
LFNSNLEIAVGAFGAVTAGVAVGSASIGCGFATAIVSAAVGVFDARLRLSREILLVGRFFVYPQLFFFYLILEYHFRPFYALLMNVQAS